MDILTAIGEFINITKSKISEIAVKTNFKIRESKIRPETFVMVMIAGQTEIHEITLDTLVEKMEEMQDGLSITKQALSPIGMNKMVNTDGVLQKLKAVF